MTRALIRPGLSLGRVGCSFTWPVRFVRVAREHRAPIRRGGQGPETSLPRVMRSAAPRARGRLLFPPAGTVAGGPASFGKLLTDLLGVFTCGRPPLGDVTTKEPLGAERFQRRG